MTLEFDAIIASLGITFDGVKPVALFEYRDAGMDPVRIVIYDHQRHWTGEGKREDWERIERRYVVVQGQHALQNSIIDYMEGW